MLAPGGLLLGNAGACFECGHEHGTGDRCLAFSFTPAVLEAVVSAVPGARRTAFAVPHLPPLPELMPLLAAAEAAREAEDAAELEELAAAPRRRGGGDARGRRAANAGAEPARRAPHQRRAAAHRG